MQKASLMPAVGAGFGLIAREPLSALVWGVLHALLAIVPATLILWASSDGLFEFYAQLVANPGNPPPTPLALSRMQAMQPLQYLGALASLAIVSPAIMRAVLTPEKRRFAYLRLSADEFHVGVIGVVLYVLLLVGVVLVTLVMAIPIGIAVAVSVSSDNAAGFVPALLIVFALVIALLVFASYFLGRLWIGAPMSLATGKLTLFDGWKLTRGYGWSLLGMCLMTMLVIFAIEAVVFGIIGGAMFGIAGGLQGLRDGFESSWREFRGPMIFGHAIFGSIMSMFVTPIMIAPWARAYQIIAAARDVESAELFN